MRSLSGDSRLTQEGLQECFYCGMPASTKDHIPPRRTREVLLALGFLSQFKLYCVPACAECNIGLGSRAPFSIEDRAAWIKTWLKSRYSKTLSMPEWEPAELRAMSGRLRQHVEAGIAARAVARTRVSWKAPHDPEIDLDPVVSAIKNARTRLIKIDPKLPLVECRSCGEWCQPPKDLAPWCTVACRSAYLSALRFVKFEPAESSSGEGR